jgi:hypothetical protein
MPLHEIDGAALLPSQVYRRSIVPPSAQGVKARIPAVLSSWLSTADPLSPGGGSTGIVSIAGAPSKLGSSTGSDGRGADSTGA